MNKAITRVSVGIGAPLLLGGAAGAAENESDARPADPVASCAQMIRGTGVTGAKRRAMHASMRAPRVPRVMTNMMAMVLWMDHGDVMLGNEPDDRDDGFQARRHDGRPERHDVAARPPAGTVR